MDESIFDTMGKRGPETVLQSEDCDDVKIRILFLRYYV